MTQVPACITRGRLIKAALLAGATLGALSVANQADAYAYSYRQYYSSWNYRPATKYHYTKYYYSPSPRTYSYSYHYVIYYPSRPTYRYYYNPVSCVYWGRYEVDENGKAIGYSMLAKKDRKSALEDIPEDAFPKATKMPPVPESEDGEAMLEPPAAPDKDSPSGKPGVYEKKFPNGQDQDQPET